MNTNSLILTIGTNPLPCLVVSKYLCKKYGISKIFLIYSEHNINQQGTKDYADRLKELIERDFNEIEIECISLSYVGSATQIEKDLGKVQWDKSGSYHLNYTGGTKTMSVHVHKFFKDNFDYVSFSYLDSRKYVLIYDDGTYEPNDGDLRSKVSVEIGDLLKLHGYNIDNQNKNEIYEKVANEFNNAIINGTIKDFFRWYKNIHHIKSECDLENTNNFLKCITKEHPKIVEKFYENITEVAKNILNAFPEEKQIHTIKDDCYKLWIPEEKLSNKQFENRVKHTWEYLDGKWLEHYVYNKLKPLIEQKGLQENKSFGWSLIAKNQQGKNFELDLYIIKGYQLIGISITTDDKTYICKSKGFEVIHRVRQIGGDESIAILITALDQKNVQGLTDDLTINTGTNDERFKIFGIEDWKDIDNKILNFIQL